LFLKGGKGIRMSDRGVNLIKVHCMETNNETCFYNYYKLIKKEEQNP
jgi:hypothetical protein